MDNFLNKFTIIKGKWKFIFIVAILVFLIAGIIFSDFLTKKEIIVSPTEKEKPKEESPENVLPEVVWTKYISPNLGFSMDTPDKAHGNYRCHPRKIMEIPMMVFEDIENKVAYISQEYYYEAERDYELDKYIGLCEKITCSLESLKEKYEKEVLMQGLPRIFGPFFGWVIIIKNIQNEDQLDKFIKENYGLGCRAGDKKFWRMYPYQEGVYDISVVGESDDGNTTLGTTSCQASWIGRNKLLYFPKKNKVMAVSLGSECTFQTNPESPPYQCYDEKMINSFRFE